jgi:hypothetical protein
MPWHLWGLATRTHRVRPSEKTTFRVISGFARKAIRARPAPRGGAGSARPQGRHRPGRDMSPVGHKPLASSSGGNGMPRLAFGPIFADAQSASLRENRPSPSPGLAPGGHLSSDGRLRGGAGSARPQGRHWLHPGMSPWAPGFARHPVKT